MGQTICRVIVGGRTVEEIESFDYSSSVMAIAEEAHFTVINKNGKYTPYLRLGETVEFELQNAAINGGAPTVRHRGRIVRRTPSMSNSGDTIAIVSADLGWHLQNSHLPLWANLQNITYADLCDPASSPLIEKSWGFKGLRFEGDTRRRLKLGVAGAMALSKQVLDPVHRIQVEAGEAPAEKITEYCKRLNLLLNVSPDGYIQCFRPNDTQAPLYTLRGNADGIGNNMIDASITEDARTLWTEVICVGDQIGYEGTQAPTNPNATKKRGKVSHPGNLPFMHRKTFADGEMFLGGLAQKTAEWAYKRGVFDAWVMTVRLAEHHDGRNWYESDTVADTESDRLGVFGHFYVESVHCSGSKTSADETTMILRKPGLLSAAFGEYPNPPIYRASGVSNAPVASP